jgi:hypothetical protein
MNYINVIILTGPNKTTKEDMWRLIHDTTSSTVVMLTNPIEAGKVRVLPYFCP